MDSGVQLAGNQQLAPGLRGLGMLGDSSKFGLVYDASLSVPKSWAELDAELSEIFRWTQEAVLDGVPLVYVVHEPSVWGHESPLRSALATAVLGGMRSAAVELSRIGLPANAVALGSDQDLERASRSVTFLLEGDLSGQVLTCAATHLGRPAA